MSDDAIHDILEQTESDPAFQALFDLFDYSKYCDLLSLFCVLCWELLSLVQDTKAQLIVIS